MLFAIPWRTADANNTNIVEERYFNDATLKSPVDIRQYVTGSKFKPPQSLQGLVRVLTNYIWLLEVLFRDWCLHMQWVLQLRDALDTH
jgi:hypothetical protein